MRIEGKRVLITGASSGLGEALAWAVSWRGATTALASRRVGRLRALSERIEAACPRVPPPVVLPCDVADRESVAGAIRLAVEQMGGIDILINNAGISVYGEAERSSSEDIEQLLRTNFLGSVHAMQEVLPHMIGQGGGRIVNIASLAALRGVPYLAAYGASKAALAVFSQSLRAELDGTGVKVQVIYPDYIQTPIFVREKKVGGARRPATPYMPVDRAAVELLRAVEREERETIFGARGKAMSVFRSVWPAALDRVMGRMARGLRTSEVNPHA